MKKLILFLACLMMLAGCGKQTPPEPENPVLSDLAVQHEQEFGGVYIVISIDDFNAKGFTYGDSVNVEFTSGYKLEDIPYYNGYYVDAGEPLLIAYPGYDYIKAAVNYGEDLWETANLKGNLQGVQKVSLWTKAELNEHSKATITLNEKGKYADVQAARDIHYYDERAKYPSDEVFANFRCFRMGSIADKVLYRSASPCDNQHNRAPYVDALIQQAEVNAILDLSDNEAKIEKYMASVDFSSPYFASLYEKGQVFPIALAMNYVAEEFGQKIAQGFVSLSEFEGPYLIHCTEGKDRTGFVCMLIEALAGASYQEIVDDYMLTYDNYYEINQQKDPAKYQVILEKNLDAMIRTVVGDDSVDFRTVPLAPYARNFLLKAGMTEEQIDAFLSRITE